MNQLDAIRAATMADEFLWAGTPLNENGNENATSVECNATPTLSPNKNLKQSKLEGVNDAERVANSDINMTNLDNIASSLDPSLIGFSSPNSNNNAPMHNSFKSNKTTPELDPVAATSNISLTTKDLSTSKTKNNCTQKEANAFLRGVTVRPSGRWQAQVYFMGKSRYIGVFDTREQAAVAYEIARGKLKSMRKSNTKFTEDAVIAARDAASKGVSKMHLGKRQGSNIEGRVPNLSVATFPNREMKITASKKDAMHIANISGTLNESQKLVLLGSLDSNNDECTTTDDSENPKITSNKNCKRKNQNDKPTQPMSAYNLFFHYERERIANRNSDLALDECVLVSSPEQTGVGKSNLERKSQQERGYQAHCKTDAKINFKDLAHSIAEKWKNMDEHTKKIFEDYAHHQQIRYKKELKEWNQKNKKNNRHIHDDVEILPLQAFMMPSPNPMKQTTGNGTNSNVGSLVQSSVIHPPMINNANTKFYRQPPNQPQQQEESNKQDKIYKMPMHMYIHAHTLTPKQIENAADAFVSPQIITMYNSNSTKHTPNRSPPCPQDFSVSTGGWLSPYPINSKGETQLLSSSFDINGCSPLSFNSNGRGIQATATKPTVAKLSVPLFDNDPDLSSTLLSSCSKFAAKKSHYLSYRSRNNDNANFLFNRQFLNVQNGE